MLEILFGILRFLALAAALTLFIRADKSVSHNRRGFLLIEVGILLVLFGVFMNIIAALDVIPGWGVVAGVRVDVWLEKVAGYVSGTVLLLIGLWYWLPSIQTLEEVHEQLSQARDDLEREFDKRTEDLRTEIERRRNAEAAINVFEERNRMLFESSPVGITHGFVGSGGVVERNQAYVRMLGYDSPAEMAEASRAAGDPFFHWVDKDVIENTLAGAREDEAIHEQEVRMRRKDGAVRWIRMETSMVKDRKGDNYYFFTFAEDVTDRKESLEAIARSEQRLKKIIRAMPVGVLVLDVQKRVFLEVNQAALRMTGHAYDEMIGKECRGVLCDDPDRFFAEACDKDFVCMKEEALTRKDGTPLHVLITEVRSEVEGSDCLIVSLLDITEQKRLEELRADVDRIVAHDLKSPIIGVINGCRALLAEETSLDGEVREMLELIEDSGEKALKMIALSLELYKMEAGTYEYQPEPVDLMGVVREILQGLDGLIKTKQLQVEVALDGQPDTGEARLVLPANPLLLETMLGNLLLNAIEAAPDGSDLSVTVTAGGEVGVDVSNRGAVMPEIRETFFDKYTTRGKSAGTGLGTYSARLSARAMGGDISMAVSDEEDRTTVTVRLPGA